MLTMSIYSLAESQFNFYMERSILLINNIKAIKPFSVSIIQNILYKYIHTCSIHYILVVQVK